MQVSKEIATSAIASIATGIAMDKLCNTKLKVGLCGVKVVENQLKNDVKLIKPVYDGTTDQVVAAVVPPPIKDNLLKSIPLILGDTLMSQAFSVAYDAISDRKLPNVKEVAKQTATQATKDLVYTLGRMNTDYKRPVNNFVWGFAAGALSEKVSSVMDKRTSNCLEKGLQTGAAKMIFAEVAGITRKILEK